MTAGIIFRLTAAGAIIKRTCMRFTRMPVRKKEFFSDVPAVYFRTGLSKKTIYLGTSAEAKKLLGKDDLSRILKDQESVIQTKDGNLFLYGAGAHGNLYAVYELLENQLNCRWLNAFGDSFIPRMKTITLKEGVWRTGYSFSTRALMNYFYPDKLTAYIYN